MKIETKDFSITIHNPETQQKILDLITNPQPEQINGSQPTRNDYIRFIHTIADNPTFKSWIVPSRSTEQIIESLSCLIPASAIGSPEPIDMPPALQELWNSHLEGLKSVKELDLAERIAIAGVKPTVTYGSPDDADENGMYASLDVCYDFGGEPRESLQVTGVNKETGTVTLGPVSKSKALYTKTKGRK